jgi:hypothetical protein
MIRINDHKQQSLFDPWHFLSPKRRRMLDESWPGLFREHLLAELPVEKLRPFLREDFGAPSKELYTLMATLLLQQTMDLTDAQTLEQLSFNIQWHYALNITEESDSAKYVSQKTLWHWRQVLTEHHLDQIIFDQISTKLATVFKVNTDNQRIDSVHIKSNMRKLGRIGIFTHTIFKFLTSLKRHHRDLFASVKEQVIDRYASPKALKAFSLIKPSASAKTLLQVSNDLYDLIEQFKGHEAVAGRHSYKLMQRVFAEHCQLGSDGGKRCVVVKTPKDVPTDSLQNPSDPDAAYSGHKGQGYQVQVMESFTRHEDEQKSPSCLNLITHVAVEKANAHDGKALMPAIETSAKCDLKPATVLGDTQYGGDQNVQDAQELGVELIAPVKDGENGCQRSVMGLDAFRFDENGQLVGCPAGYRPDNIHYKKKTNRFSARFAGQRCQNCPHVDQCPIKPGKKYYYLWYSAKDARLACRRQFEDTPAFIDIYRWRAGVEATMSQYDRLTGVKHLRVRGFKAVRFCATLKATGLNLLRAAAVRMAQRGAKRRPGRARLANLMPFLIVKEPTKRFWPKIRRIIQPLFTAGYDPVKTAA